MINPEAESYILSPRINQRIARIGSAVLFTAIGVGIAAFGANVISESKYIVEQGIGALVASAGIALSISIPTFYFRGDPDLSPHRLPPPENATSGQ